VQDGAVRLLNAARSLNQTLDPSRLLVRVCEEGKRLIDAERADVYVGASAEELRVEATYGGSAEEIGKRAGDVGDLAREAAARGEPVSGKRSLALPLRWEGKLRGVLALELGGGREAGAEELEILEGFAELAEAACRNAAAHAELALEARTDGLTGCLNHAAMHDTLRRELERCRRLGHGLSLAIVDLDDFKQVNERHGHLAGDELLRRVGRALRDSVRAYDVVARYGGDEFAVIAINADEEAAAEVLTRALGAVARELASFDVAGEGTAATAGVAEWRPDDSPTMLIARADRALLHGKHSGLRGTAVRASSAPGGFDPASSGRG
jgi:diguanylate cyclase (GGDEF)-like protein